MHKPLYQYAGIIKRNWDNIDIQAKPDVDAMFNLNQIDAESKNTVRHFLEHAKGWKGDIARNTKRELKELI